MKKVVSCIIAALSIFSSTVVAENAPSLPTVSIAGKNYYVYEIKKGDSLYGIANRFGWNLNQLIELNPSMKNKATRGAKIYFPTTADQPFDSSSEDFIPLDSYPVVRHFVKKGETVYSIARLYQVPVETIYQYNPSSRKLLKRGDVITIPQNSEDINGGDKFYFYTIRPGDTLAEIADHYNTSIEQILRDNRGVSEDNFKAGDLLRLSVNSNRELAHTEKIEETKVSFATTYKADKNDSWESVARKTGADVEDLKDANPDVEIKKNALISIPKLETSEVERVVEPVDQREATREGRLTIYNEVHGIAAPDSIAGNTESVNIAIIIEDPAAKRDNEFIRGALVAIDRLKNSPYQIKLTVLHDRKLSEADSIASVGKIITALDQFDADILVASHEKNFPKWLAEYGEQHGAEVINVFDVKSELYMDNPTMIHLLTPSAYFTEEVADWVENSLPAYKIVMVGKADPDDAFASALISRRNPQNLIRSSIEDLPGLRLEEDNRYLFYGYPQQKDEVASMLSALEALKDQYPLAQIKVMGRPSWITIAESMKEQFSRNDVCFPSRFFFDHTSPEGKSFIADYTKAFGHGPIRSFPTYSVAGFDMVNYFVPGVARNDGDFNVGIPEVSELQTPISLQRAGNWSGFFNPSAYIVRYTPYGAIEKILIKK